MQCYPEYKESGIDSIGKIPEHWVSSKLGYVSTIFKGGTPKRNVDRYFQGDLPWARPVNITGLKGALYINDTEIHISEEALGNSGARLLPVGTVLLTSRATIGETAITTVPMATNQGFANFYCNPELFNVFLVYYLQAIKDLLISLGSGSTFLEVTKRTLLGVGIPAPPLPEQHAIANFLDHKTQQIDELIRAKERKIELLQEYRASLINQAVTKGLDPNVEMNPSGVEWIGNVPKHWEVKKIKYLARLISKGTTPTTIGREILDHGEIRFIKAENIVDNQVKLDPEYYIDEETNQMLKRSQLKENDILFVIAGTIGKVGLVSRNHLPANTNQAVSFIRPYEKELPEFIYYWLQSDNIQQIVWRDVVQTAQPNLSMEDLGNLYIPYPSIAEQERIVDYISNKTRSIAQLLQQVYRQIELLKEYRQSLISAVVTGKIDVRNEV